MAKAPAKKKSSLTKWLIIGGGLVIVFLVMTPQDNGTTTVVKKPAAKKAAGSDSAFQQIDFDKNLNPYPPLKLTLADAFRPDIIHGTGAEANDAAGPGWTYSGMAVVNGVGQGVLVNMTTGDSAIVHRGESWQNSKVMDITADHLVLNGPNGPQTVSVDTKESEKPAVGQASSAVGPLPGPMAPYQMPLTGDIGSGDQSLSIVGDTSGQGIGRGGRGGRRRGRNAGN